MNDLHIKQTANDQTQKEKNNGLDKIDAHKRPTVPEGETVFKFSTQKKY
jgi:hypothetical protein